MRYERQNMLILDEPSTWPRHIVKQLNAKNVKSLLENHNAMDCPARIMNNSELQSIFVDVQEYAESEGIAGYHCTKQLPDKPFTKTGLRILDFETHHKEFLELIRNHKSVNKELFARIDKALSEFRADYNVRFREKQLWFCLTRRMICEDGGESTKYFFKCYGGEAIFMPFIYEQEMKDAVNLLEQLGEPVVVEAQLSVSNLNLSQYALGRALVSYFAEYVNPDFSDYEIECYASRDILPDDIIKVHSHAQFVKSLNNKR